MAFTVFAANSKKPDYAATGRLRFTRSTPTASITEAGSQVGKLEALLDQNNPLDTEIEIIQSKAVVNAVIQGLNLVDEDGETLSSKDFLDGLKVYPVGTSDVLAISYVSSNAEQAAQVVNRVVQEYLQQSVNSRRQQATTARQFVEQQLPQAKEQLEQAEQALVKFRQRDVATAASQDPSAVLNRFNDLQQQVQNTQTSLVNLEGRLQILRLQFSAQADSAATQVAVGQSPTLQAAQNELEGLERELARQRIRYQDSTPIVQTLKEEVEALRKIVEQRRNETIAANTVGTQSTVNISSFHQSLAQQIVALESEKSGLENQIESLKEQELQGQQMLKLLPKIQEEQRTLEQAQSLAQATHSNLLQKINELRIAEAQSVGNAKVLEYAAVPKEPASSKTPLYAAGFLLSCLLSGLWVYTAENRYRSRSRLLLQPPSSLGHLQGRTSLDPDTPTRPSESTPA